MKSRGANLNGLAMTALAATLLAAPCASAQRHRSQPLKPATPSLGLLTQDADIGTVLHPGSAHFDAAKNAYTLTGSGDNMWFGTDAFHFLFTKVSGDVSLSADIAFIGATGNDHRKAVLMLRQTLGPGSVYVDVARHGNGLTSLQYRETPNADTHEIESAVSAPQRVRILKRGNYAYVFVSDSTGKLVPSGAAMRIALTGDFYIGLGVCSHNKDVSETAVFSNVELQQLQPSTGFPVLYSTLETITIASTDRRVAYVSPTLFEAPNWTRDGKALLFNQSGLIYSLNLDPALAAATPTQITTTPPSHINNDHGLSPDGSQLAISDQSSPDAASRIYILPITGGTPRQITPTGPSYWHSWSPDGKTLAFTAQRGDPRNADFDIYTVPVTGGPETRLTTAKGLDDGPEYAPDGSFIYFNSERNGHMQLWRMKPDGTDQQQLLHELSNDWFPHISPDGKWLVYLAYDPSVAGHPADKDVELRLMSLPDGKVKLLAKLFGGQGTINVPSWSPDSTKLAFVSYELLPQN
jgi:TolB protein